MSPAGPAMPDVSPVIRILTQADNEGLQAFFERALELHAGGAVTTESAVDYFMLVVAALDQHTPAALRSMWSSLEEAWREDDG